MANRANQTPSHWVYNDMTLQDGLVVNNGDLMYPLAASQSTFNSYLADSQQNSPARFIQQRASSNPYHVYSNEKSHPPPPYPTNLSTVMPIRTRSPLVQPRLLHTAMQQPSKAPPTSAPPPAPTSGSLGSQRTRKNKHDVQPFYALVKAADSSSELYARPPSDHFYFKITDGKTEFI